MKKNILIAGAGQLGSRHLQGLAPLDQPAVIWVYDPSAESRATAELRWNEVSKGSIETFFCGDLNQIPVRHFNLCIVATNSQHRRSVIEDIVALFRVDNFILEKVLFPRLADYDAISNLLTDCGARAWVNCPRRMFPFYKILKDRIGGASVVNMDVAGHRLGLGCNGIHFIDLFAFLTGASNLTADIRLLDEALIPSKRPGYVEFTGRIDLVDQTKAYRLSLSDFNHGSPNVSFRLTTKDINVTVSETMGTCQIEYETDGKWTAEQLNFAVPFQSQLTHIAAGQVLRAAECDLTPFSESSQLHQSFLSALLEHYNSVEKTNTEVCPIT